MCPIEKMVFDISYNVTYSNFIKLIIICNYSPNSFSTDNSNNSILLVIFNYLHFILIFIVLHETNYLQ